MSKAKSPESVEVAELVTVKLPATVVEETERERAGDGEAPRGREAGREGATRRGEGGAGNRTAGNCGVGDGRAMELVDPARLTECVVDVVDVSGIAGGLNLEAGDGSKEAGFEVGKFLVDRGWCDVRIDVGDVLGDRGGARSRRIRKGGFAAIPIGGLD